MRINSIRLKAMFPTALLAVILVGLFIFSKAMTSIQQKALTVQNEHYFAAISAVLNADRDIYQARLAIEKIYCGEGALVENRAEFEENAQQVLDRFHLYRKNLESEPELLASYTQFEQYFQDWYSASELVMASAKEGVDFGPKFIELDRQFGVIRQMLDQAGEKLNEHTQKLEAENIDQATLNRYIEAISEVLKADVDIYQARLAMQKLMIHDGLPQQNKASFKKNAAQALQRFHAYRAYLIDEPNLTEPYQELDTLFTEWHHNSIAFIESTEVKTNGALSEALMRLDEKFKVVRSQLDQAGEDVRAKSQESDEILREQVESLESIAMVIIILAFIVAIGFGYYMPLLLTRNVKNMANRIKEIAEGDGDLTARINSSAGDELGDLAHEFDGFVEHLRSIIKVIHNKSEALGGMTEQFNGVSSEASAITLALVDASNSIVSASSEMNMSNQQMAEVAKDTVKEANNSNQLSKQGIAAVNTSNQAISSLVNDIEVTESQSIELEKSSQTIASVLEVIRKIAEQTNLLALNAAIEAARAGEQGRGFAVVADEVRTLATRTQDSTNEIEGMIEQLKVNVERSSSAIQNSRKNAESTVDNFSQVIQIFDELRASFGRVQEMADHTAQATQEQSAVSSEINQNLVSLKEQTDGVQNVADEIQSQSHNISDLYQELNKQVGSFKV
ncbi:methyl-accepting chemotaxis protein [Agarivorans sp. QJM3NY_25]|uniref:methyl-accepting chemotaxis protein n=1 Tax=Agarivorans sp. QJM3NY_25 TaxID=3421430 RepID=UPI003D7CBC7E